MKTIHDMFSTMMTKLQKLDTIENNINDLKHSLEYAQAEIADLRKENEEIKSKHDMVMKKINSLERDNATIQSMRNKIIDLQARSMRDNLLFFNIPEHEKENTIEIIHDLLEQKIEIEDASKHVKIDRSHRIGRKREGNKKPRPIVVKFREASHIDFFHEKRHMFVWGCGGLQL